jgi:hypothetical protein
VKEAQHQRLGGCLLFQPYALVRAHEAFKPSAFPQLKVEASCGLRYCLASLHSPVVEGLLCVIFAG